MMGTALFFVFAAVALAAAVLVITSRSVVYSALYLILSFLAVAGLFILQGAEFLGYCGPVLVPKIPTIRTPCMSINSSGRTRSIPCRKPRLQHFAIMAR